MMARNLVDIINPSNPRYVLITGCSTGIGRACAVRLARCGFHVLATVRNDADAASLANESSSASVSVHPLLLDVRNGAQIESMKREVANIVGESGLYALVNNAGICIVGPVECVTLDEWRDQFDVNFFAPIAMIQCFLPLMRAFHSTDGNARPRIVNINSTTGEVATPVFAAYSASKMALKVISDCLRLEIRAQGIHVCSVIPGTIRSEIWRKEEEGVRSISARPLAQNLYTRLIENVSNVVFKSAGTALPADDVAKIVERALISETPKDQYFIGWAAHLGSWAKKIIPDSPFNFLLARSLKIPNLSEK